MIECSMTLKESKVCIKAKGHAGYAEEGKDIVCASASMLCNTFVEFLRQKNVPFEHRLKKGDIEIKLPVCGKIDGFWDVLSFVAVGFYILSYNYPDNVEFRKNF